MMRDRGFALMTAIVVMALVIAIGYAVIQLVIKGLSITGGSKRYSGVIEAAEASLDKGFAEIDRYIEEATIDSTPRLKLGNYTVDMQISPLYTAYLTGSAIEFASGYEGIGYGLASGGAASYFLVESNSRGPLREVAQVEVVFRKVLNVRGREP